MALRFNPPPNWPKPPEGWQPDAGWRPDPQWGPAPQGWPFWVDERGNPVPSARPEDPSAIPEEPTPEPAATQHYPQQSWDSQQNSQNGSSAPNPYAAQGGQNTAWNHDNTWNQPPKKKNFFASPGGILSIIGAILVVLVVLLVLALTGVIGGHRNDSEATSQVSSNSEAADSSGKATSSGDGSASHSAQASATGAGPSGTKPQQKNIPANDSKPIVEYSGSGEQSVKTDKLEDGKVYYLEYWYQGDSNFSIWGLDDKNEHAGLYANDIDSSVGSNWLDLDGLFGNPKGFDVETEGQWEIKVYDANAVQSKGDRDLKTNGSVAFAYQGPKKTGELTNLSKENIRITAYDLKGDLVFQEHLDQGKKATLDFPASSKDDQTVLVQVKTAYNDSDWKITYK